MYCNQCGKEVKPGSRFCSGCGAPVGTGAATPDMMRDISREPGLSKETAKEGGRSQQQEEPGAKSKTEPVVAEELDVNQVTAPRPPTRGRTPKILSQKLKLVAVVAINSIIARILYAFITSNQSINKIAFTSNRNCLTGNNCSHVYLMDTDGSNLQILTTGTTHNANPAISPDGKRVVFSVTTTTYNDALFTTSLADMKVELLKERLGSSGGTMGLSWSPNGKSLVYVTASKESNVIQRHIGIGDAERMTG